MALGPGTTWRETSAKETIMTVTYRDLLNNIQNLDAAVWVQVDNASFQPTKVVAEKGRVHIVLSALDVANSISDKLKLTTIEVRDEKTNDVYIIEVVDEDEVLQKPYIDSTKPLVPEKCYIIKYLGKVHSIYTDPEKARDCFRELRMGARGELYTIETVEVSN
jgi:hypothetical protein